MSVLCPTWSWWYQYTSSGVPGRFSPVQVRLMKLPALMKRSGSPNTLTVGSENMKYVNCSVRNIFNNLIDKVVTKRFNFIWKLPVALVRLIRSNNLNLSVHIYTQQCTLKHIKTMQCNVLYLSASLRARNVFFWLS